MASPVNRMVHEMALALRASRRIIKEVRDEEWNDYTIPPDRSFKHMNKDEARAIRRYDRIISMIDAALR